MPASQSSITPASSTTTILQAGNTAPNNATTTTIAITTTTATTHSQSNDSQTETPINVNDTTTLQTMQTTNVIKGLIYFLSQESTQPLWNYEDITAKGMCSNRINDKHFEWIIRFHICLFYCCMYVSMRYNSIRLIELISSLRFQEMID